MDEISFFVTVAVIVLIVYVVRLGARVNELEEQLRRRGLLQHSAASVSRDAAPTVETDVPSDSSAEVLPERPFSAPEAASAVPKVADAGERPVAEPPAVIRWLTTDPLMKFGALLILIAVGWFVSYAFANDWIGPVGRITLGLLLGAAFQAAGFVRLRTHAHQAGVLIALGAAMMLVTVYAARALYDFFTPLSALCFMLLPVVLTAAASVISENRSLALGGLVLGSVAPLLTAGESTDGVQLFAYLLVVVCGTLWVVQLRGWQLLVPVALGIVSLYSLPYLDRAGVDLLFLLAGIHALVFFAANSAAIFYRGTTLGVGQVVTAFGTFLFTLVWTLAAVPDVWQSVALTGWALCFALGAFAYFSITKDDRAFYLYSALALTFVFAATAAELSGPALTIALLLEVAALLVIGNLITLTPRALVAVAWLFLLPGVLALPSFAPAAWRDGLVHGDAAVATLLTVCLIGAGLYLRAIADAAQRAEVLTAVRVLLTLGVAAAMALCWRVYSVVVPAEAVVFAALTTYTVAGLALIGVGQRLDRKALRYGGGAIIGFVLLRLLFIDVWEMDLPSRIVTFAVIGLLLLSTAWYLRHRPQAAAASPVATDHQ